MPIGTIENNKQVDYKLVYGIADGMPNSLESMVVCACYYAWGLDYITQCKLCYVCSFQHENAATMKILAAASVL